MRRMVLRPSAARLFAVIVSAAFAGPALAGGADRTGEDAVAPQEEDAGLLEHVTSLLSLYLRDIEVLGFAFAALAVLISAGGKIDGGGALDVIYIFVLRLGPTEAIALSSVTIFGGAIAELLADFKRSKRFVSGSLINWQVLLIMQPMLLMGAAFGASMGSMFPTWLLMIALAIYLGWTGTLAAKRAVKTARQEQWRCAGGHETVMLLGAPGSAFQNDDAYVSYSASIPWKKVGLNATVFSGTLLLTSLQGGALYPSPLGIPPTSFLFLFVSLMPFVFLSVVSHYLMKDVVATYQRQQNLRYILQPNEVQWSPNSLRSFPLKTLGAGTVSGLFGVSGGVVCGPLLRGVGVGPASASATTAVAAFFSTGQAAFNFLLWGKLTFRLALLALPMGFVVTLLARFVLARIVRKFRVRTVLFATMALLIVGSFVPMSVAAILHL